MVDFFLFPSFNEYMNWELSAGCNFDSVQNALVKQQAHVSYSLDWPLPDSGNLVAAFLYTSHGEMSNADISVTYQILYQATSSVTTQVTLMIGSTTQVTLTDTLTNVKTVEVPFLEANASWLVPLVLVAIVVVLFLVLRMRPRKRRRRS
jgi:hypothetical protein